jgi:hypothetical protein
MRGEEPEKQNFVLYYKKDHHILKDFLSKIRAYKILTNDETRKKYMNTIRLRSMASQYLNITDTINDGHFFPFLIFSVFDVNSSEPRMMEINFVEEQLHDRYKDHCCRSYHFSMLKRVNKTISPNDNEFTIEFNNEKYNYRAVMSTQANFIVAMLQIAIEETQIALKQFKSINNPENQNLKSKDELRIKSRGGGRSQNSLGLRCIMTDQVLPTAIVRKGQCKKKNAVFGAAERHLMLGTGQLIIAR